MQAEVLFKKIKSKYPDDVVQDVMELYLKYQTSIREPEHWAAVLARRLSQKYQKRPMVDIALLATRLPSTGLSPERRADIMEQIERYAESRSGKWPRFKKWHGTKGKEWVRRYELEMLRSGF